MYLTRYVFLAATTRATFSDNEDSGLGIAELFYDAQAEQEEEVFTTPIPDFGGAENTVTTDQEVITADFPTETTTDFDSSTFAPIDDLASTTEELEEDFRHSGVVPAVRGEVYSGSSILRLSSDMRIAIEGAETGSQLFEFLEAAAAAKIPDIASRGHSDVSESSLITISIDAHEYEFPSISTNESYEIDWTEDNIRISARSVSGVAFALETLAQMTFASGALPAREGHIRDSPSHAHRGLLVDTGRRFWPQPLLKQTVDAMSAAKLNVLHLHFTDNCRFAIESVSHPELVPEDGQFLTQAETAELIRYAAVRGVRVVPEIDIPGHGRGMRNAQGVTWLDDADHVEMTDSVGTRQFLFDILTEFAALFPDEYFHIGADETEEKPTELLEFAIATLMAAGKKVVGWEEAYFVTGAGTPATITTQLWKSAKLAAADEAGLASIFSSYDRFYMELLPTVRQLWFDIRKGAGENSRLLGGELAMWTDDYCPLDQCHAPRRFPAAGAHLFAQEADEAFGDSINRQLWPKSFVAAGAMWNRAGDAPNAALPGLRELLSARFGIRGCVDTPTCRCSMLVDCAAEEPELVAAPLPASRGGLAESADVPPSVGVYMTRTRSWKGTNAAFIQHYGYSGLPHGDIFVYHVDAWYSKKAFADEPELTAFLLGLNKMPNLQKTFH